MGAVMKINEDFQRITFLTVFLERFGSSAVFLSDLPSLNRDNRFSHGFHDEHLLHALLL
jgi:hypothetical protein